MKEVMKLVGAREKDAEKRFGVSKCLLRGRVKGRSLAGADFNKHP